MKIALTVQDHIDRAERVFGNRIAVIDEQEQPAQPWMPMTYRDMAERARAQAAGLDALGVGFGERVAIVSHNSARLLTSFFGVSGHGRVLVPINYRLSSAEVAYIVEHSGASMLLIDPELEDQLVGVDAKHRFVLGAGSDAELYRPGVEPERWSADEDSTATINYTSGTTARPKGVQLTHRNLWLNATVFGWHAGVSDRERYLHTLPMFHCNGWGMVYAVTAMGGLHVVQRSVDGRQILDRIDEHDITLLCGAPAVGARILDALPAHVEVHDRVPGRDRCRMVMAGAPPPTATIEAVERDLGWEFLQIYGLTETTPVLTMSRATLEHDALGPEARARMLGRAGAPVLGCRVDIDDNGEILARGNMVMDGYWDQPEATAAAVRDGWFHTGDGGVLDEGHNVTITDRKKDVIISGGENVSSIEVEDVLFSHPSVGEVAVIGVPHETWGETVKALVVAAPGTSPDAADLVAHCRSRLAHFKCPTSIEFRDELARTATGKLQKFRLRAPYWDGRERLVG